MTIRSTVASGDGTDIAVHDFGGSGDVLIVAHATGFCAGPYRPMAAELTHEHRVVGLDFRGHGDSATPHDDNFAWTEMANDLLAVVDHLGTESVHVFGHSMGGAAALLAERTRPGVLRSAYLFEPIVFSDDRPEMHPNPMAGPARARRATFESKAAALVRYASRRPLDLMRADALAAYVDQGFHELPDGNVTLKCTPENEARTFESEDKVRAASIRDLSVATTVGIGVEEPGPNPAQFGPMVVDALANATLERFDLIGHLGPFQDPPLLARAVLDHVDQWRHAPEVTSS